MPYDLDPLQANCYPGTGVLENRFGIQDAQKLEEVEAVITTTRAAQWLADPKDTSFSFEHYKAIHRFMFSDLYTWAGQIRVVDISKKGTRFCPYTCLNDQAGRIFARLAKMQFLCGLERDAFVREITDLYCTTNDLHPFREGNGRTQRTFLTQLVRNSGREIRFALADPDELMIATIQASQGVIDLLRQIMEQIIE